MKFEMVKTALKDFRGPCFPKEVEDLNITLNRISPSQDLIERVAKETAAKINRSGFDCDFKKLCRPTTEDGYTWYQALYFETDLGTIVILIPWASERSVAVYADGQMRSGPQDIGIFRVQIENILKGLNIELRRTCRASLKWERRVVQAPV